MKMELMRPAVYADYPTWYRNWVHLDELAKVFGEKAETLWEKYFDLYGGIPIPVTNRSANDVFFIDRDGKILTEDNEYTGYCVGESMPDGCVFEWDGDNGIFCPEDWADDVIGNFDSRKPVPEIEILENGEGQVAMIPSSNKMMEQNVIRMLEEAGYRYRRTVESKEIILPEEKADFEQYELNKLVCGRSLGLGQSVGIE